MTRYERLSTTESGHGRLTVVLLDTATGRHKTSQVTEEAIARLGRHTVIERAYEQMERAFEHEALPTCIVTGCTEKAREVFIAAASGRLAGQDFAEGAEIRLCPEHGHDVWKAQFVRLVGDLPEWLQADARPERLDAYDQGHGLYEPDRRLRAAVLAATRT